MKWSIKFNSPRDERIVKALNDKVHELTKCVTTQPKTIVVHLSSLVETWKRENPKTQTYPISICLEKDTVKVKWENKVLIKVQPLTNN